MVEYKKLRGKHEMLVEMVVAIEEKQTLEMKC